MKWRARTRGASRTLENAQTALSSPLQCATATRRCMAAANLFIKPLSPPHSQRLFQASLVTSARLSVQGDRSFDAEQSGRESTIYAK